MIKQPITIQNKLGLHTRAAAKLVAIAAKFESKIELLHNNHIADCKSIMSVILLGGAKGMGMELVICGADELEARDAIVNLINSYFGEDQ
ncbi:MAG: HPr family phosphocarrier protein [Gammaproteobacteria bacterium]